MTKFVPLNNRMLVRPETKPEKIGRIFVPPSAQGKNSDFARVVALGPGTLLKDGSRWPMPRCKPGDRIAVTGRYLNSAPHLLLDGVEHRVITANDVQAVLEEA